MHQSPPQPESVVIPDLHYIAVSAVKHHLHRPHLPLTMIIQSLYRHRHFQFLYHVSLLTEVNPKVNKK